MDLTLGLDLLYLEYKKKYGDIVTGTFLGLTILSFLLFALVGLFFILSKHNIELFFIFFISGIYLAHQNISMFACIADIGYRNNVLVIVQSIYVIALFVLFVFDVRNVWIFLLFYMLNFATMGVLLCKHNRFKISFDFLTIQTNRFSCIKRILLHGFKAMLISLLIVFNYNLDVIMLKSMGVNLGKIGIYGVAVTLSSMVLLVPDAFKELALGDVVKSGAAKHIKKYIAINTILLLLIVSVFAIVGKFFITLFYGKAYLQSYSIVLILFIGDVFMCFYKIIHPLFIADGKQNFVLAFLICAVASNFIFNYILIPQYDIFGAAIASAISYSITGLLFLFSFIKKY